MSENIENLSQLQEELRQISILIRTNNLLLSRFILELSKTKKELGLPKRCLYFKFDLLEEEYFELCKMYSKDEVDKVLYRLDRMLLTNKQQCPNNIAKYVRKKINRSRKIQQEKTKYGNDSTKKD